jgi:acetyltransferase-like isoleucine patch superfamily enzyme
MRTNAGAAWRFGCTITSIVVIEAIVCATAALPVVAFWSGVETWIPSNRLARAIVVSLLLVPSYIAFALCLMMASASANWLTGARTPPGATMRISEMSWPLMRWGRYMVSSHLVRLLAGSVFRGSPIWSVYLRLNGAKLGKRVYVNSLFISDHNLLEFDDDVVIGGEVHLSGHTVEAGVLKTAPVRLGRGVTIGVGTVIDIGVTVGAGSQVGALSLVPKYTTLEPGGIYAGIPVRRLDRRFPAATSDVSVDDRVQT